MAIIITYRRTSRLSMRIAKNFDVHVSAPIGLPREQVDRFIDANREWIAKARQNTYERQKQRADFYNQLPLRTQAQCEEPTISRWGQCDVKERAICFSAYLLLLPEWCVEHVVVHELCHLLEPSHNARFHALMDRYFPRWREARAETRRISQEGKE